jgi:hypothetical protein
LNSFVIEIITNHYFLVKIEKHYKIARTSIIIFPPMTATAKVLIGVGAGLVLLGIVVIVGGYFVIMHFGSRMAEKIEPAKAEGVQYGRFVEQQGCIDKGLERARSTGAMSITDGLANAEFVQECLKAARPTKDFCVGVPSFFSLDANNWTVEQCRKVGMDELKTGCIHVFKGKHEFCSPPSF